MSWQQLIPTEVRRLATYQVEEQEDLLKLSANENPHLLGATDPRVREILHEAMEMVALNRYPDPGAVRLRTELARKFGVTPDMVLLGNGSDELIVMLLHTFSRPRFGKKPRVLIPQPTFAMYGICARYCGMVVTHLPLTDGEREWRLDRDALLEALQENKPNLLFIAYPNNPTGNCFARESIEAAIEWGAREGSVVVVDEAYSDFSGKSFLGVLRQHENLVILRSFSMLGMAGLRLGALMANPEVRAEVGKVRLPYNVNSLSQEVGRRLLAHPELLHSRVRKVIEERHRLFSSLQELTGITPYPSEANFILFRVPGGADAVFKGLKDRGVLVRNLSRPGLLDNTLRVTVGTAEENMTFLSALREVMGVAERYEGEDEALAVSPAESID